MRFIKLLLGLTFFILFINQHKIMTGKALANTLTNCNGRSAIYNVIVSEDNKYIASIWNGNIRVWNVQTGRTISDLSDESLQHSTLAIAISYDDKYVLTGSPSGTVILWDLTTAAKLLRLDLESPIHYVSFLPSSNQILLGTLEKSIVWDIKTKNNLRTLAINSQIEAIEQTQMSENGKYLLTKIRFVNSDKFRIIVWDINTGEVVHSFNEEHPAFFFDDGKYVISSDLGGYHIWDIQDNKEILFLKTKYLYLMGFSPDGKYLYGVDEEGINKQVIIFSVQTGMQLYKIAINASVVKPMIFHDSRHLMVGKKILNEHNLEIKGSYSIYDLKSGVVTHSIAIKDTISNTTVSFITPNDQYLVIASTTASESNLRLWDINTGNLIEDFC